MNRLTDIFAVGKFDYGVMVRYQNLTRKPELFQAPWARAPLGPGPGTMYPVLKLQSFAWGTLLQPWPNTFGMRMYFSEDYVIPSPKLNEDQIKKKLFADIWSVSPSKSTLPAIWYCVRPKFVGFIHTGWLFFVWSSSAQISMGDT